MIRKMTDLLLKLTRREPGRRSAPLPTTDRPATDWLPPVLSISDLSSPYFLAMADRDAGWYLDHHRHRH